MAGDRKQDVGAKTLKHRSGWSSAGLLGADNKDLPRWLQATEQLLRDFATLPDGWDSSGAKSIERHAIDAAMKRLCRIGRHDTRKPAVVPTNQGGSQIEWHTQGADLELEITPHREIHMLYANPQENVEEELELGADLKPWDDLIAKVSSSQ
ncbi:MAG TPA: hypothetical protein VNP04_19175 [Alphaproteobacteria bacterium]|nr:hypothetical protein [Alphaproteobacteria bacterium]